MRFQPAIFARSMAASFTLAFIAAADEPAFTPLLPLDAYAQSLAAEPQTDSTVPLPTLEATPPDELFDDSPVLESTEESIDEQQQESASPGNLDSTGQLDSAGNLETLEEQLEDPVSERNFQSDVLVLRADHLFGDWCGYRTALEDDGITPSVTFVSDMLGNPVGGLRQGFAEADNLGVNFNVDMEKRYGLQGGHFQLSMSQRSGRSLSNEYIGNTFSTQQVWGGPTFKVINVAYQQTFGDDEVEFEIGRLAAGDTFLVSQYNYLFVQNGFCGNPVGIFFNAPGMSAYPNATWGSVLQVRPTKRTYAQAGLYNGDPSIRDSNNHGLDLSIDGPPFAILEVAYESNQQPGDNGMVGNYKLGAWFDGNDFANLEQQALSQVQPGIDPEIHTGNYGFYALADQVVLRWDDPGEEIARGLGVVGSCLVSPDESVSQMPYFFNAGIAARGLDRDRPRDVAAFGVIFGEFSRDLRSGQRQAAQVDPSVGVQHHEIVLEWTYIFRFQNGAYFIQPDVQYILDPSGTGDIPNALVVGTQVGVNF
jgi:porin